MTHHDARLFLRARGDKYASHDPKALAADHTVDGVVHSPMFASVTGRDAIEQSYVALFRIFPDWSITFDEAIIDSSGRAAHPCDVTATHRGEFLGMAGTGKRITFRGVLLYTLVDGLIAEESRLYDFTGLLFQAGVLRARPS